MGEHEYETVSYTPTQAAHFESYSRLEEGATFTDRYTILGEVGRGGMGIVYKAHDNVLNTTLALKIIHPLISSHTDVVQRFKQETLLARSVSHENVVRIHDIGELEGLFYLSMDYIQGQNLKEYLLSGAVPNIDEKVEVAKQICRALVAAHDKGIVHRDLKPQNIMVDEKGRILVSDFGLAKSLEAHDLIFPEGIVGTPPYMSPEQSKGVESDKRSDIYSLGVIFYEMFCGKRPFEAETRDEYLRQHIHELPPLPQEINPQIPDYLREIVLRCLKKDPANRYTNVKEIIYALERRDKAEIPPHVTKTKRAFNWAALAVMIILAAILGYYWIGERGGAETAVIPESERIFLAVMRFEDLTENQELENLSNVVQNYLYNDLAQSRFLRVFPDDKLLQVLSELGVAESPGYSSGMFSQISVDFDIQYFVLGSIEKAEDGIMISASLHKAQSDEDPETMRAYGQSIDDISVMVDSLTKQIKAALNLTASQIAADEDGNAGDILSPSEKAVELYMKGRKLTQERRRKESAEVLEAAVKIDPEFAMAYLELTDVYQLLQKREKSRDSLSKAFRNIDRVSERNRLVIQGYVALELNKSYLESIKIFGQLVEKYPQDTEAHGYLAWMYRMREEWEKALHHYQIMANSKYNVNRARALDNIAWIYTVQGAYDEALGLFQKDRDAFSNQAWVQRFISSIHIALREYDTALDEIDKALEIEPGNGENYRLKGNIQVLREKFAEAEKAYRIMIQGEDETQQAWGMFWLANLHLTLGQYHECRRLCYKAIDLAKELGLEDAEADLWLLLFQVAYQQGEWEELERASGMLVELSLNMVDNWYHLIALHRRGVARLKGNRLDEAKTFAEGLRLHIEGTGMLKQLRYHKHLLGLIACEEGKLDSALEQFEAACALLPQQNHEFDNHAFFLNAVADAYAQKKDYGKAWAKYEQLSRLSSGRMIWGDLYVLSFYEMGKIAQLQNRNDDAIVQYKRFLSLWSDADENSAAVKDAQEQLVKLQSNVK